MQGILQLIFQLTYFALIARVLLSWIPHDRYHPVIEKLYAFTDPILEPFKRLVPAEKIGLDISPIFAFIALNFLESFLYSIL